MADWRRQLIADPTFSVKFGYDSELKFVFLMTKLPVIGLLTLSDPLDA